MSDVVLFQRLGLNAASAPHRTKGLALMHHTRPRSRRWFPAALVAALSTSLIGLAPTAIAQPDDPSPFSPDFDASWGGEPFFSEEQLATNGEDDFPNYRIAALTVTNEGDVLASYDGRPTGGDAPGPNWILQHRSSDSGDTWQERTTIREGESGSQKKGFSDPSYIVDRVTGDVFNFHVFSMDQGFGGSQPGTDLEDRNVIHTNVARSSDGGQTWSHRTITPDITPNPAWRSRFAASGQGIQLKYGEHAGRLIQQFTIINNDVPAGYQAVSVYSDDHGDTWQAGEPVGVGMDENKTVELSDGRVMLNSRDSHGSKFRKVAISEDGGHTYGEVYLDRQLPDPTNNASIVRAFPNAAQNSAAAKVLLFSNAASQTSRSEGTVRMSCDDGQTWPVSKVFQPGGTAYSTLATLPDGNIGLLYEPDGGNGGVRFAKFNLAWLGGICAGIDVGEVSGEAGTTVEVPVAVTNQTDTAFADATLSLELPDGWSAPSIDNISVAPGATTEQTMAVTVPASTYAGEYPISVVLTADQGTARSEVLFTVTADDDATITVVPTLAGEQEDYARGDSLNYHFRITNITDQTVSIVPSSDDLEGFNRSGTPNCGYQNLVPGGSYTCSSAFHSVTETDLAAGTFTPDTTWTVHSGDYNGEVIDSLERTGPTASLPTIPGLIPQSELSVHDVSSEETVSADTAAENAIDGAAGTLWHTAWANTEGPHWITLDLGQEYEVSALRYLARQGGGTNGMLREYELFVSVDGENWGEPVAVGELERSTSPQVLEAEPKLGRFVKLDFLTSWSDAGRHFASAAELNVAEVVVEDPVLTSVADVPNVEVPFGTSLDDAIAALAPTTTVTDSSDLEHEVELTWAVTDYDAGQPGDFQAEGSFELPDGVTQPEPALALEVQAVVTVLPAEDVTDDENVTDDDGVSDDNDETDQGGADQDSDDQADAAEGSLPKTGASVVALALGSALVLAAGTLLMARRRLGQN